VAEAFYLNPNINKIKITGQWIKLDDASKPILYEDHLERGGGYKTCFGPCFSHDGVSYKDSPTSLTAAIPRLLSSRPDEDLLRNNQYEFFQSRIMRRVRNWWKTKYSSLTSMDYDKGYRNYVLNNKHPKYHVRREAFSKYVTIVDYDKLQLRTVKGNVKTKEWAKPGKKARLVNDLGVKASLIGGYASDLIKTILSEMDDLISSKPTVFVKSPDHDALTLAFKELNNPTGSSYFCYFSDDSCYSVHCADGIYRCNLDISSCDMSCTSVLFDFLLATLPPGHVRNAIEIATLQCTCPLEIKHHNRLSKMIVEVNGPTLYSGSTLTTIINNVANRSIAASLSEVDFRKVSCAMADDVIKQCARKAGFIVTCDSCPNIQDIQFLKHSPTLSCEPVLNLGVMLRAIGFCHGDLPGRHNVPLKTRARIFNSSLVKGWIHAGDSEIYRIIAGRFNDDVEAHYTNFMLKHAKSTKASLYTSEDVCARYKINPGDYDELCSMLRKPWYGHVLSCTASAAILKLDYGLSVCIPS
jgi:hypothetical protein